MSEANHMAMNVSRIAVSVGACPARPERCYPPPVRASHFMPSHRLAPGRHTGEGRRAVRVRTDPGEIVMAYETIRYERGEHIGTLTLARPEKRNAQNPLMWQELADLGVGLLADETLRCLV